MADEHVERRARANSISAALRVNAIAICDCGHREFQVGLRVEGDENHIRVLECTACEKQMAVPFQAAIAAGAVKEEG